MTKKPLYTIIDTFDLSDGRTTFVLCVTTYESDPVLSNVMKEITFQTSMTLSQADGEATIIPELLRQGDIQPHDLF